MSINTSDKRKQKAMGMDIKIHNSAFQNAQRLKSLISAAKIRGLDVTLQDGRYVTHVPVNLKAVMGSGAWPKFKSEKAVYRKKLQK